MDPHLKFVILWIIIIIPFISGTRIKKSFRSPQSAAKFLIRLNLIFLEPFILFWTIWGLSVRGGLAILPVAGVFTVLAGFIAGKLVISILKIEGIKADSYIISSSLSNQGFTLGGFICYIVAGETGLGLASIYAVYFLPLVFGFIFPFAGFASKKHKGEMPGREIFSLSEFVKFFFDLRNLPLAGIIAAIILQLNGIKRPDIYFPLDPMLFTAIIIYYFTLGLNFRSGQVRAYKREQVSLAVSKFIILPLLTYIILKFLDLNDTVETVILIQSFMPAAIYSVLTSILFDLDSDFTSGLFVVNSVFFLVIVLPLLLLLL
jgi:predicted permease